MNRVLVGHLVVGQLAGEAELVVADSVPVAVDAVPVGREYAVLQSKISFG
jgi:hypothetical protein